jgi:hypothetical protein
VHVGFTLAAADELELAHAVDALESGPQHVFGVGGEGLRVGRARDGDLHDGRRAEVELLDDGRFRRERQVFANAGHAVAHVLGSHVQVHTQVELHEDLGHAFETGGAKLVDTAEAVDGLFDRIGHFGFHRLGVCTGIDDGDGDDGEVHLGEEVYGQA